MVGFRMIYILETAGMKSSSFNWKGSPTYTYSSSFRLIHAQGFHKTKPHVQFGMLFGLDGDVDRQASFSGFLLTPRAIQNSTGPAAELNGR